MAGTEAVPAVVTVSFEGPEPQRRLTIAFRIILAIPHLLYLSVLAIVVFFTTVVAWFAALILGRLPSGLAIFLGRLLQYWARVYAYAILLLTDRYPRFGLDAPDYPVSVGLSPGRLNRLAVLFRIVLAIPAAIVTWLVGAGVSVAAFFVWLIALVLGRLPQPLFEAYAAILRYEVRYYAYLAMLTSEYPRRLFGDGPDEEMPAGAGSAVDVPAPDLPSFLPARPPVAPDLPAFLPARPRVTRLVLSRGGKRLVVLIVALGVVFGVGGSITVGVTTARSHGTGRKLADDHTVLTAAVQEFSTEAQGCALGGGAPCLHAADERLAGAFARFRTELESLSFPLGVDPLASRVEQDTTAIVNLLRQLASISDAAQYQAVAAQFQTLGNRFDADYRELLLRLLGT